MGGEEIVLQKISLDGTEREDICTIAKCYKKDGDLADNTFTVWGVVHRGYLYYVYNFGTGGGVLEDTYYNNNSNILFRIKIDGSGEPECIMPLSLGGNISFMRFQGAGSYLYVFVPSNAAGGTLYRMNTESGQVEDLGLSNLENEMFVVVAGKVIYKKEWNSTILYDYDPDSGEEEIFADLTGRKDDICGALGYDGQYLYVYYISENSDLNWTRVVLDEAGNYVTEFRLYNPEDVPEDFTMSYLGGTDYFLCYADSTWYYLDKSLLASGEAKLMEGKQ